VEPGFIQGLTTEQICDRFE